MENKRILVIRFTALGDTLLVLGILEYLHNLGYTVDFITDFKWAPIFEEQSYINRVFYYKKENYENLVKEMQQNEYEFVVDLQQKLKTAILAKKLNAKKTSTVSIKDRIIRHLFKKVDKHTIEKYLTAFYKLGILPKLTEVLPRMEISKEILEKTAQKYPEIYNSTNTILVSPFASKEPKFYPWKNLEELLKKLSNDGFNIVIVGIESEINSLGDNFKDYQKIAENNILIYSGLVSKSLLLLSNDSGPKNIADALQKKSVVFWGPTHPRLGFGVFFGYDIYSREKCSPCSMLADKPCKYGDYRCYNYHSVDEIYSFIKKILK